jgi:uncharacterized cofD-like protein
MKNIVIIGGGTGTSTLLLGLKKYPVNLSVIVPSWDDGGSNGRLRSELDSFPYSDARQCLVALAEGDKTIKQLFDYRFGQGSVSGHTAANLMLAALEKITGGPEQAIAVAERLLKTKGKVLPVTLKPTVLTAVLENGKKIIGEHNIDERKGIRNEELGIRNLQLKPNGSANPKAIAAIKNADLIIFGPGDLHTSVLPNLLVKGVTQVIFKSKAKKILVTNIMTKHGQTDGFKASDFVKVISGYLGKSKLDFVIINDRKPSQEWLKRYKAEKGEFVWPDISEIVSKKIKVEADNFLADYAFLNGPGDKLKRSLLRHNSEKLSKTIWQLIS